MRYTTRRQDIAFLAARLAEQTRDWKVGDATLPYKTCNPATTIVRRFSANGSTGPPL